VLGAGAAGGEGRSVGGVSVRVNRGSLDHEVAHSTGSSQPNSCDARVPRASFCEDGSHRLTSCAPHLKSATKLLDSQHRSDRGACGFVLTAYSGSNPLERGNRLLGQLSFEC
jgi:hypothetical protein